MSMSFICHTILLFSQGLYMVCLLPQAITNYRVKSGKGLSDLFIAGYLNGHFAQLFYVFCLDLPIGYKIFVPVQFSIVAVLVFQRLYYERFSERNQFIFYTANILLVIALIPLAYYLPTQVGIVSGWTALIIFSLSQLPQVLKIYSMRSVQGFSLMFVLLMGFGSLFELTGAFLLCLPHQTIFNAIRNCSFILGCLGAFCLYGNLCSATLRSRQ